MAEYKQIDLLDYLIFLNNWKMKLIIIFLTVFVVSYVAIYLFIPEKFDAQAVIIPSESQGVSGIASLIKNFSGLPLNMSGMGKTSGVSLYNTIVLSRTNLEKIINKFDLYKEYNLHSQEKTLKELVQNISTNDESESGSYSIRVRASSPQKAADMTNYIIDQLNNTLIELNVQKSRDNRIFIEKRYEEIKQTLASSEDSLKLFEQKSKFYSATDQTKAMIDTYSKLESDLAVKQLELSIFQKIYGTDAPITKNAQISYNEYASQMKSLKNNNSGDNLLLPINSLPDNAMAYLRLVRDIKMNNTMLEFIVPLLEEAKFDEEKNIPVLQVIDRAVPPEKKSYPQRVLISLLIAFFTSLLIFVIASINEVVKNSTNEKIIYLRKELFKFRKV
ncbi:MAG: Wzz/FepE/Etk N-terminal domain-containing protein [Ignavibacteriaceae bacterium]|nr:Wzz/FepE/Etk N-terminal domain-containing protein [Ignavibacteriaceae bacterium]